MVFAQKVVPMKCKTKMVQESFGIDKNHKIARILKLAVLRVDSFVMDWISKQFVIELADLVNPVDNEVLLRLITKLQNLVPTPWGRLETSPKELLTELIRINTNFKATDGLSWSSIAKRKLGTGSKQHMAHNGAHNANSQSLKISMSRLNPWEFDFENFCRIVKLRRSHKYAWAVFKVCQFPHFRILNFL